MKIPVSQPYKIKAAEKYILDCLNTGWVSSQGPYIEKFEKKFARYLGVDNAITTTSGTAAIYLALAAINLTRGDEVIIPTFTMISSAAPVVYLGGKPVFIDSTPDSWTMAVDQIEKKITAKTKAIMPVHIYGHPVNMDPLLKLARKYDLYVIEDAAEAIGSEYKDRMVGTLGDLACFSFYANKLITTGEGGMVVTNNPHLARRLRLLKDMAHSDKKRFLHIDLGYNFRFTNLQAALGYSQMATMSERVRLKRKMAALYNHHLRNVKGISLPVELPWARSTFWMYGILVDPTQGISRDTLASLLKKSGIDTRDFFIPMHQQPIFKKLGLTTKDQYPVADKIAATGLYLPSAIGITEEEILQVCHTIKKIYASL